MARSRNIKPGFFKNEDLAECSSWARLCFAGLWILADREGRLEDRPKRIKGELFAYDSIEVEPLLAELEAHGFLVRYRNDVGSFIQISKFSAHQTPHYSEKPSVIKPPELLESGADDEHKKPGALPESKPDDEAHTPRTLQEDSRSSPLIKRGSQPPDSLIPDSLIPDSLIHGRERPRRGARLPPDWGPGDTGLSFASKAGLANGRVQSEVEKFRDYWAAEAGQKASKIDWQAAWRTWVRNSIAFGSKGAVQRSADDETARFL